MPKPLKLRKVLFLDENKFNPLCNKCKKETGGYLITQKELVGFFSPEDIGFLIQSKYLRRSVNYKPKLIIFLCKTCTLGEKL